MTMKKDLYQALAYNMLLATLSFPLSIVGLRVLNIVRPPSSNDFYTTHRSEPITATPVQS